MKIVGLNGPSCSGKSTLARHLRLVLPNAAILYEDDFYLPESELPLDGEGQPNWETPQSFDLAKMRQTLVNIKRTGTLPNQHTREDENNASPSLLSSGQLEALRRKYAHVSEPILLLDGILLYHQELKIDDLLDLKVLIPFEYESIKSRREARGPYVTNEGNWTDPPHFFEKVVWPEFKKHCGYLYVSDGSTYKEMSAEALELGLTMVTLSEDMEMLIDEVMSKLGY